MIAMHHPPLLTGIPAWDALALRAADRDGLREVLARHDNIRRIVAGHVHRTIAVDFAGSAALTAPSTYLQGRLRFGASEIELTPEAQAGFVLHALIGDEVVSHVQPVARDSPGAP